MKLTKILLKFSNPSPKNTPNLDIYVKAFIQFSWMALLCLAIWFGGAKIMWHDVFPLAQPEKRLYIILSLLLLWVLKFLILDLDETNPANYSNPEIRNSLQALHNRFHGVIRFLKKTTVNKHGHPVYLSHLPWYLLIGPSQSGKTTLLANAKVHYILQKQLHSQALPTITPSDHCDWWITRDLSIVDVPGKYMSEKTPLLVILWRTLLRLTRSTRGKQSLNGIMIALSLPEMMKQGDVKKYQTQIRQLFTRVSEIRAQFPQTLPTYLVITKCDQLAGFKEFFAESSEEELGQVFGLQLPALGKQDSLESVFTERFDALIKKLNRQLLWRLHQERNPMARPYIKDFPLQVERLKEFTLDFVKRLQQANSKLSLRGIYLTSALQPAKQADASVIDEANTTARSIQTFKEPAPASTAYFIHQLIVQGLPASQHAPTAMITSPAWARRTAYAASAGVIALASIMFGNDFAQAVKQAYAVQNTLSDYQLTIQKTHDSEEQLIKVLALLNALQQTARQPVIQLDLSHILTFYSSKAMHKSAIVYHHALEHILVPQLKIFIADYLKNPVNKNSDAIYAALEAYLMLGDPARLKLDYMANTLRIISPKTLNPAERQALISHVNNALRGSITAQPLDTTLIQATREYLTTLPNFQLAYIILKNINNNNLNSNINLGLSNTQNHAFAPDEIHVVPRMFTAQAFPAILSKETLVAAREATNGNWVLGSAIDNTLTSPLLDQLLQQLREAYVSSYVELWENVLANIRLTKPTNLAQTDKMIVSLIGHDSPLLQLLQTLHDNTYFEPITTSSPKLLNLGLLVDKRNSSNNTLYQIFAGLQAMHHYLHGILTAENQPKAAFEALSIRMRHTEALDSITQLRIIAGKSPDPIKHWLENIANEASRYLLQEATRYIDLSWREQVNHAYEVDIAHHFPFDSTAAQEVELSKFTAFFGNPGVMLSFYHQYLAPFVDTSAPEWRWKSVDNFKLPFSDDALHQLQYALRIHHMFFPNGDDKLNVTFSLQPHSLSKSIKRVKLSINDRSVTDQVTGTRDTHLLAWPSKPDTKMTSLQLVMQDQKTISRNYPGDWGWFKLVSQSIIETQSPHSVLVNFYDNAKPVEYILYTQGQSNPFITLNLQNLHLPANLFESEKQHV